LSIEESDGESQKEVPPAKSPSRFFSPTRPIPTFRVSPSPLPRQPFSPDRMNRSSPFRRTTTPRSKLRHEDSQIQFEAIHSSPIIDQESQLLTERQKEVAERQRLVTAPLFHNISSPARKRASDISSDPLHSDTPEHKPSTPILQPALDDEVLGSSPIAASVSRRQSLSRRQSPIAVDYVPWKDEEEIPSSPPRGDEDEDDSGFGAETNQPLQAISPLRLQSKLPAHSSHGQPVEEVKLTFANGHEDLPVNSETVEYGVSTLPKPSFVHDDREPRSSVEREMVNAQLTAEAYGVSELDVDNTDEEREVRRSEVTPSSSIVVQDQSNQAARQSSEQVAVAATSEGPAFDGSTTDPISSEAFVVNATAPTTARDNNEDNNMATAIEADISVTAGADFIPDSQFALQPQATRSIDFDASRIIDSFPAIVNKDNIRDSQSELLQGQSTQEETSQNSVFEDPQSSLSLSMDSLNQSQNSTKRKRGRPSVSQASLEEPRKRVKMNFDLHDWKYYAGFGNKPAKPPASSKLDAAGGEDLLNLIVVQPDGEKLAIGGSNTTRKRSVDATASLQPAREGTRPMASSAPDATEFSQSSQALITPDVASEGAASKRKPGKRVQKIPVLSRRQSGRISQGSAGREPTSPAGIPQPLVPSLRRALSSRLSEILHDNPGAETSSAAAVDSSSVVNKPSLAKAASLLPSTIGKPSQNPLLSRKKPLGINSLSTSQATRSSSRLLGAPSIPDLGQDAIPRVRRPKRTLSQSQDSEDQAGDEKSIITDSQAPARKKRKSMAPLLTVKPTTKTHPPNSNSPVGQIASVHVTPDHVKSRRALRQDHATEKRSGDGEIGQCDEDVVGETSTSQVEHQPRTPTKQSSQVTNGDKSIDGDVNETQDSNSSVNDEGRMILSPKSIMARLKGILADCKNMVFGSQERREMDDIMFEIKNEVFGKPAPAE
jgi:hypothetical protein